jgi:alpha-tubulin suppressor-like RCC1 family protein
VRRIATSARHTLVCSSVGSLYSCGDNSDGALGHGDVEAGRSLKLVAWFADASLHNVKGVDGAIEIVELGAGADLFGSHSAAVDSQGRV